MRTVCGCFAINMFSLCVSLAQSPVKQEYLIGGFGFVAKATPVGFMNSWKPALETYLTDVVGNEYEPKIRFRLVPVDFTENTTSKRMIEAGLLDFLCEC